MNPTRRAVLASPLAFALPRPSTAAVVPPELVEAAAALGAILDRMATLWDEDQRLHALAYPVEREPGALAAFRRFDEGPWQAACDAMDAAEARLLDAMESAGVPALAARGKLYAGLRASVGMDADHYPGQLTVIDLAGVVGLDSHHHQRSTDR